jgi:hypothetical protein
VIDPRLFDATLADEYKRFATVQRAHERELLSKANVVAVGIGTKHKAGEDTGRLCIVACVSVKLPQGLVAQEDLVPSKLRNVPTDVQETGFPEVNAGRLDQRRRPAFGGLSISHVAGPPGTLGTGCYDEAAHPGIPAQYYFMSCNHVIANSNAGVVGDAILQPGVADGGSAPTDTIGTLARFWPIQFANPAAGSFPLNFVDAAVAQCALADVDREIYWIGHPRRKYRAFRAGEILQKTGKTTGFTTGNVLVLNATGDFGGFPGGQVARFALLTMTSPMSQPGDSGAIVCDMDGLAVGMIFGSTSGLISFSFVQSLHLVEGFLGVRISPNVAYP